LQHVGSLCCLSFYLVPSRIGWAEGKNPHKIILHQKEDGRKIESAQVHVSFISKQVSSVSLNRFSIFIVFSLFREG
jgi:hypothetical protein